MSRNTGTFNFAANFEVLAKAPLDAKQLVGTKADLTGTTTWSGDTGDWLYNGAIVGVGDDPNPENNGIYWLSASTNYSDINSWVKAGSGTGIGTITGGTNGLSTSGANIVLGGDLTGNTSINLISNELQITTSGLTPSLIGIDPSGILLSTSGSSVSMDTNEGLIYGSTYSSSNPNWIPTKLYVDGVGIGLNVEDAVFLATTGNSITLSGNQTIDGVLTTIGMRVLVKDQSNPALNGIYSANTGTWGRTPDYNFTPAGEIANGDLIPVTSGLTLYNSLWAQTAQNPIVSGDTLTFTLFSKPNVYVGGTGIDINVNTISVDGQNLTGNSLTWTGDTFNVDINTGTLKTALDSKLDITTFSGYTGTTDNRLNLIENQITGITATTANLQTQINYISGVTDTKLDIITFSGYTGTTETRLIGIENDIAYISGVTDTKLDIITFSGYTGTTQPILDSALTGATNGLSTDGRNVKLGGVLSEATTISMSGTTSLTFTDTRAITKGIEYSGDYEANFTARSLVTQQYVTGYTQTNSNTVSVCNVNVEYTATTTNDFIGVSGATCIYLPATPKPCQRITISDIEGDALTNGIEVNGNGKNINGSSIATINTDYGSMTFINNNISGWSAVAFIN